jgi:acyl carrier protein
VASSAPAAWWVAGAVDVPGLRRRVPRAQWIASATGPVGPQRAAEAPTGQAAARPEGPVFCGCARVAGLPGARPAMMAASAGARTLPSAAIRAKDAPQPASPPRIPHGGPPMASSFDRIADIIAENSEVERDKILPDSHVINDLGIDSLDFLDIVFAIDKAFGIKVPVEAWTQEVNAGTAPAEQYFVMKNLAARIDELVAAKGG